ncbi:unnamed protein product, partial [Ranitomeya imitator]
PNDCSLHHAAARLTLRHHLYLNTSSPVFSGGYLAVEHNGDSHCSFHHLSHYLSGRRCLYSKERAMPNEEENIPVEQRRPNGHLNIYLLGFVDSAFSHVCGNRDWHVFCSMLLPYPDGYYRRLWRKRCNCQEIRIHRDSDQHWTMLLLLPMSSPHKDDQVRITIVFIVTKKIK